jgi:hypothetical protein
MAQGFIHTVYKNGNWVNEVEGGSEFGGSHSGRRPGRRWPPPRLSHRFPGASIA